MLMAIIFSCGFIHWFLQLNVNLNRDVTMVFSTYSVSVTLLLVMDPLEYPCFFPRQKTTHLPGSAGLFLEKPRLLLCFWLFSFLWSRHHAKFNLELPALSIAGGLVLFLIAIKCFSLQVEPSLRLIIAKSHSLFR